MTTVSRAYDGQGCSPGTAVAAAWAPRRPDPREPGDVVGAGADEVRAAFTATAASLERLAADHRAAGAPSYADILDTEALIARDPTFAEGAVALLDSSTVLDAVRAVADQHAAAMEALDAPELRERATDIRLVGRMVVDRLLGRTPPEPPGGAFVLVGEEVSAPDLLAHAGDVAAAVSQRGGPSSHASIVARSLGIPFVVAAAPEVLAVDDGVPVLVDGDQGRVVVSPAPDVVRALRAAAARSDDELAAARALPARTRDGVDITLLGNVAAPVEARRALAAGAQGVGLLRTELAFLDARDWPTRAEHERALRPVLEVLAGRPVTARLLDFTNDKTPPFLTDLRGRSSLAVLLDHPDALDAQLAALLAFGREVDLKVLVPMVTDAEELRHVRARLHAVAELAGAGRVPPVGAMLETPAAVTNLPALLGAADFVSVGTNDLTAATLGLARTDTAAGPARAAHPAVLRQVERAVLLADESGTPLSVCGDAAADPAVLPLLVGLGVTTLSVAPSRLDAVRDAVRGLDRGACRDLARSALGVDDSLVSAGTGGGPRA